MGYEFQNMEELNNNIESTNQDVSQEIIDNTKEMRAMTGGQAGAIAYGIHRISEIPAVNSVEEAKEFVERTGVSALAVKILLLNLAQKYQRELRIIVVEYTRILKIFLRTMKRNPYLIFSSQKLQS